MVVLGFLLMALVVVVTIVLLLTTPDDLPEDLPPEPIVELDAQVLFITVVTDMLLLDCIVVGSARRPAGPLPDNGTPFTLALQPPATPWLAERVEEMVGLWCDEAVTLRLELRPAKYGVRTTIVSPSSSLCLELAGAAGLPGPAPR